jgi:hypothetical protein
MAKLRLNNEYRLFLRQLARNNITCATEVAADEAAYKAAEKIVRGMVIERFPTKDMNVLKRYNVAVRDTCFRIQLAAGGVVQFEFRGTVDDVGIWVPYASCASRMYIADEAQTTAIQSAIDAESALEDARERKLADYGALIEASTTLEQVEEIWSEASALRAHVGRALPSVLSDDVIARIKEDVALRVAA